MVSCDVAAVVVTLKDSPRLRQAIDSVRSSVTNLHIAVICVINDPSASGTWQHNGVHYVGAGMNLGWAGGVHAGLIGVDCQYVWLIQDDMIVDPHALSALVSELENNHSLASVRPLDVDTSGVVAARRQGNVSRRNSHDFDWLPLKPTRVQDLTPIDCEGYLSSSGQLIRSKIWDTLGGFDPWFFPWGYIDVDFAQTLRVAGWKFQTVLGARMTHQGQKSTTLNFRSLCLQRNAFLYGEKWGLHAGVQGSQTPPVSPWIAQTSKHGASKPRETDLVSLHNSVGISATDFALWISRALSDELTYIALRQLISDSKVRRSLGKRAFKALRGKLPRTGV